MFLAGVFLLRASLRLVGVLPLLVLAKDPLIALRDELTLILTL